MNENENTTTPNLWDTVKAVLRGRFIAIQAYLKKREKSQINNPPCLFNLYAEYIMRNARVEETQAGIKIARRNTIKNSSIWKLNNTLLSNQKKSQKKSKKKLKYA